MQDPKPQWALLQVSFIPWFPPSAQGEAVGSGPMTEKSLKYHQVKMKVSLLGL